MILHDKVFLGFDPGGQDNFGVALIQDRTVAVATVSSVSDAVAWALAECGSKYPLAAGIDTLLHWCDGRSGWRPADLALRQSYPSARSSILSPNGLFGSMAIGGMALAMRLREHWPDLILNESHPKVLFYALAGQRYRPNEIDAAIRWFLAHSGLDSNQVRNEHELDALISAWATRFGMSQGWSDLVGEDRSLIFPAGRVQYLWPNRSEPT